MALIENPVMRESDGIKILELVETVLEGQIAGDEQLRGLMEKLVDTLASVSSTVTLMDARVDMLEAEAADG